MGWRVWCSTSAVVAVAFTGCSVPGRSLQSAPEATSVQVDTPLRDPVWSYRTGSLIALTDDGRVAAVELPELQQAGDFDAGPAAAYLSEDSGMRVLLALSTDGSTVTPVEEFGLRKLPGARVRAGATSIIDGANRGRAIEYHVYGPAGIAYYKGPSSPPEHRGSHDSHVVTAAGDGTAAGRVYFADTGRDMLYAVETARGGHGMHEIGRAPVASPVRHLGSDDTRVYAATDTGVTVFESAAFTGYPHGSIPVLRVIDYRAGLPSGPARSAPLSGMAIGPDRVYLTLRGQPIVVSVAKPRL